MEDHVKIRQEYVRLVRARKHDEAQKLLEIIWNRKKPTLDDSKSKNPTNIEKNPILIRKPVFENIDSLKKIKGIGNKTLKDIKVMFGDLDGLKDALKNDKVALRDDIVEKLKEVLI